MFAQQLPFMRNILLAFLLLFIGHIAKAQVTISGIVKDQKGKAIPGASLSLKDSYDGATTDSAGHYRFTTTEKGDQILVATSIGYKTGEEKLHIAGTAIKADMVLKEEVSELKAVVITAGAFEASDKKKATVLNSIDIVTTASANADITAAIKTLPGTQQVGESEGLFVRGGTASETKIFIDGTLVNSFFYSSEPNIATRGRFSPFIFKGTVFSAGGYSALYGQALSSALILESIDLPDVSSASFGVSPLGVNAGLQELSKNKNWSWGASYSYTNVGLVFDVLKPNIDYFKIPQYHTADANFRIKTSKTGMLKYYGYFSANKVGLRRQSIDTLGYKDAFVLGNVNTYHNLSWRENIGSGWKVNAGASYSYNQDHINGDLQDQQNNNALISGFEFKNFLLHTNDNYVNAKVVLEKKLPGLSALRFGGEYNYSNERYYYTLYNG